MAETLIKPSFASGELSPSLWGRTDMEKFHTGASVVRNMFVNYRGGLSSRAGTRLVGICKQSTSLSPPRLIPFAFSLSQSYILEFGTAYMRVIINGAYLVEGLKAASAVSHSNPAVMTVVAHGYSTGDWVVISGLTGMTQLNGKTAAITVLSADTFSLGDPLGGGISSIGLPLYTGGGGTSRIYTLTTPYAAADLPYLKYAQSADVLSLCCVNQATGVDYPPQDLIRHSALNWTIAPPTFGSPLAPPAAVSAFASFAWATGPGPAAYGYVVTAVDTATGEESLASNIGVALNSPDIGGQFGTVTVNWSAVVGAASYNIYKAPPDFTNVGNFVGQLFGYVGSTISALTWKDTNIIADFTVTPPIHFNPFQSTANYPSVVGYFQERRVYGGSLNEPDTYRFSQTGAFTNFDVSDPPVASDAITGTPWALEVAGLQWFQPMAGGLIVGTGIDVWQLSGTGGAGSPITPSQQNAQPQESNGLSPTVGPIKINYELIYANPFNNRVYDLQYSFFTNVYAGVDIAFQSNHLFENYTIGQWTYAREPAKIIWTVRNDGKFLSLTFLKEQQVIGWARHDTNGQMVAVASATEPPVNAVYFVSKRYVQGRGVYAYMTERMDNREWQTAEDAWCLDAALSLPLTKPAGTLTADTVYGSGAISGSTIVLGGSGLAGVAIVIIDPSGVGSGATATPVLTGGVLTGVTIATPGSNYVGAIAKITATAGVLPVVELAIDRNVTFTCDQAVFSGGMVGDDLRMSGGIGEITSVSSSTRVVCAMASPILLTVPDDPLGTPLPAASGAWSVAAAVTAVAGLDHLEGMQVSALVDGAVVQNLTVANGSVTLPFAGSVVVVGLPFTAQLQSLHLEEPGKPTIQGKRKRISAVTLRVEKSRGARIGANQPVASILPLQQEIPWTDLSEIPERDFQFNAGNMLPLFTGDLRRPISDDWMYGPEQAAPGFVAIQQDYPLPLNVLAIIPEFEVGDTS